MIFQLIIKVVFILLIQKVTHGNSSGIFFRIVRSSDYRFPVRNTCKKRLIRSVMAGRNPVFIEKGIVSVPITEIITVGIVLARIRRTADCEIWF